MKVLPWILLLAFSFDKADCQKPSDSLLRVLRSEIVKKKIYDDAKECRLNTLRRTLARITTTDFFARYALYNQLYDEYKDYEFDSSHVYTVKLLQAANQMHDLTKQYESKIKLGSIQLSWGMYKEAFDCIAQLNVNQLADSTKLRYYGLKSRALYVLAAYNTDEFYSPSNHAESIKALDSAVMFSKPGSYERYKLEAQLFTISAQKSKAAALLTQLLHNTTITDHQRAMVASDLSYLTIGTERIELLATASINDIRSSTKQTLAIFTLGKILFEQGNLADAELLLSEAMAQAKFYGNRLRERESLAILTQVSAQQLIASENKKNKALVFLIGLVSVALIGVAFIFFIVYTRLKKVRIREVSVQQAYKHLDNKNKKLLEDAKIKEEYIGYFFNVISGYILKLEKIKRNTERKLKIKNDDDLLQIAKEIDIKQERENLFYTFDKIFLKLFPNFITSFNSLLKPEDQIWPKDNEVLNTNLRVFALMRLGIKDSQTMANILETSISTIYTYKNRIRSKALVQGDDFEKKLMDVKFVDLTSPAPTKRILTKA